MSKKYINDDSGFTLIEMIMVITIMAVLTAIIAPNFLKYYDQARKASDIQTAAVLGESLENILIFDQKAASEWQNFEQAEVQQSGITMHFRAHENDLMRICKNEDSGRVEVWVGGAGEGRNCKIYYRLYPDPDPRYMSSDYTYRPRFGGRKQNNSTNIDEIDGWNAYDKNGNPIKNK